MRNYQSLALIGGILGIVIVPIMWFFFNAMFSSSPDSSPYVFDSSGNVVVESVRGISITSLQISVIVSIIAIVIVFSVKNIRKVGYILFGLAIVFLITTNISGVVTWVLFFVAGAKALRWKEKPEQLKKSGFDALKEQDAKGENPTEEPEDKKKDLE